MLTFPTLLVPSCLADCTPCDACPCVGGSMPLAQLAITNAAHDLGPWDCDGSYLDDFLEVILQHQYANGCVGVSRRCESNFNEGYQNFLIAYDQALLALNTSTAATEVEIRFGGVIDVTDLNYVPFTNSYTYFRLLRRFRRTIVKRYGTTERTCPDLIPETTISDTITVEIHDGEYRSGSQDSDTGVMPSTVDGLALTERITESTDGNGHFWDRILTLTGPTADAIANEPGSGSPNFYWYGANFKYAEVALTWL